MGVVDMFGQGKVQDVILGLFVLGILVEANCFCEWNSGQNSDLNYYSSVFVRRPQTFDEISQLIWCLLSKFQIIWEILSIFVVFLEDLIFKDFQRGLLECQNSKKKIELDVSK